MSVTARGGYQIVDFKKTVLTFGSDGIIIPGIFDMAINVNKPLCFTNLSINFGGSMGIIEIEPIFSSGHYLTETGGNETLTVIVMLMGQSCSITIDNYDTVAIARNQN